MDGPCLCVSLSEWVAEIIIEREVAFIWEWLWWGLARVFENRIVIQIPCRDEGWEDGLPVGVGICASAKQQ